MTEQHNHILFIASWYPNRNAPALGNFIQRHAQAAALFNKITVVYATPDKNIEEDNFEIVQNHTSNLSEYLIYYGKVKTKIPFLSQLKKRNAYRKAIMHGLTLIQPQNALFNLIHVHVIWPAAIAVLPLLNKLNIPMIISEHWSGYLPEDGNFKGFILRYISKQLAKKAAHLTVVSERMKTEMIRHGFQNSFSTLANSVDVSLFNYVENKKNDGVFHLLHVSMLVDREKNISGLLKVMHELKNNVSIQLTIIGDGPEKKQHEELAKQMEILDHNVTFLGFMNSNEVAHSMQQADALIMFSNFEGMPVTIIEGLCCGLPIIATNVGSISELVNESNGILLNLGDEKALLNAILQMKENQQNYSAKIISENAISKFNFETVGRQINELYHTTLAKNGR